MEPWTLRWPDGAKIAVDLVQERYSYLRPDGTPAGTAALGSLLEAEGRVVAALEMDQEDPSVKEHTAAHGRLSLVLMADLTAVPESERETAMASARDRVLHRLQRRYGRAAGPSPW